MMTTNLWVAIAALLTVALIIIWWPYFRNTKIQASEVNSRSQANTLSYQQSLATLQQQFQEERISESEFESLKTELARKLIQDEASQEQQLNVGKRTVVWPILASVLTIGLSVPLYLKLGASDQLNSALQAKQQGPHAGISPEQQLKLALQQMEQRVAQNPEDTQALYQLAHSYISAAEFDKAVAAFKQLVALEGEQAEFIGPQAQALYYKNQQVMTPQISALIERALELDPQDSATLVLLGMDSFVNSKYADAITQWQKVLTSNRPGIDIQALNGAIAEAKSRLTMTGEALPDMPPAVDTPSIKVKVSISGDLKGQYSDEQVVFIYAIPQQGPRMPLAAVKLTVKDLPTEIVLDDSLAMTPAAKISDHQFVQLFAIISKSGSAGIKPGDLRGLIESADLTSEHPYSLIIDSVVE